VTRAIFSLPDVANSFRRRTSGVASIHCHFANGNTSHLPGPAQFAFTASSFAPTFRMPQVPSSRLPSEVAYSAW
jgi:hypothetical protein